jgi:hypothetical protein
MKSNRTIIRFSIFLLLFVGFTLSSSRLMAGPLCEMGVNCFGDMTCCGAPITANSFTLTTTGKCLKNCSLPAVSQSVAQPLAVAPAGGCAPMGGSGNWADECYTCNPQNKNLCAKGKWDCFNCDALAPSATPPPAPACGGAEKPDVSGCSAGEFSSPLPFCLPGQSLCGYGIYDYICLLDNQWHSQTGACCTYGPGDTCPLPPETCGGQPKPPVPGCPNGQINVKLPFCIPNTTSCGFEIYDYICLDNSWHSETGACCAIDGNSCTSAGSNSKLELNTSTAKTDTVLTSGNYTIGQNDPSQNYVPLTTGKIPNRITNITVDSAKSHDVEVISK